MDIKIFLESLGSIASSPFAFVAYLFVAGIWGVLLWRTQRIKIIAKRIRDLPEKDRLKALQLEYKLLPRDGLDAETFLQYTKRQYYLAILIIGVAAFVIIFAIATYRALEERKISTAMDSMAVALEVTKLGRLSADQNRFARSAGNLEAVLKLYPTFRGYMNLGYTYEEISDTNAALAAYTRALELQPNDPEALNAIGFLYKDSGKYDLAEEALHKARRFAREGDESWFMATGNLGNVYYEQGRKTNDGERRRQLSQKALQGFFLPALRFRGAVQDQDLVAKSLANIGNAYKDTDELEKAGRYLEEAVTIKRKLSANRSLAESLNNFADLLLKQQKYSQAKPYLLEAGAIFEVTGNTLGRAVILFNLGDIAWFEGDTKTAQNYYRQSSDLMQLSGAGGEYQDAPRRRLERLAANNPPEFITHPRRGSR